MISTPALNLSPPFHPRLQGLDSQLLQFFRGRLSSPSLLPTAVHLRDCKYSARCLVGQASCDRPHSRQYWAAMALLKPHWGCSSSSLRKTSTVTFIASTSLCSPQPLPATWEPAVCTPRGCLAQGPTHPLCTLARACDSPGTQRSLILTS